MGPRAQSPRTTKLAPLALREDLSSLARPLVLPHLSALLSSWTQTSKEQQHLSSMWTVDFKTLMKTLRELRSQLYTLSYSLSMQVSSVSKSTLPSRPFRMTLCDTLTSTLFTITPV